MTTLFACETCSVVDSSELVAPLRKRSVLQPWLCTVCLGHPWHNLFPRAPYNPEADEVFNKPSGIGLS